MLRLQRWTENDIVTMGKGGRRMTVTSRELGKSRCLRVFGKKNFLPCSTVFKVLKNPIKKINY